MRFRLPAGFFLPAADDNLRPAAHESLGDRAPDPPSPASDDRNPAAHVEQLTRYCERVDLDPAHKPCRGILVAPEIAPQARVMCEARGLGFVELDFGVLRGDVVPELTLFE